MGSELVIWPIEKKGTIDKKAEKEFPENAKKCQYRDHGLCTFYHGIDISCKKSTCPRKDINPRKYVTIDEEIELKR